MSRNFGAELADIKAALDHLEERGASPQAIEEIRNRVEDIEGQLGFSEKIAA
jgi:hypothetical protein